jgi:hypothetical protein
VILEDLDRAFPTEGKRTQERTVSFQTLLNCLDGVGTQDGVTVVATEFAQRLETYILGAQSAFEHGREVSVADVIDAMEVQTAGAQDLKTPLPPRDLCAILSPLPAESSRQMHKALEHKLVEWFPTWFDVKGDMKHTLMSRGFTHGDGWFDILWRLCGDSVARRTRTCLYARPVKARSKADVEKRRDSVAAQCEGPQ